MRAVTIIVAALYAWALLAHLHCVVAAEAAPSTFRRRVVFVQVAHRHGARDFVSLNETYAKTACGDAGCGALTPQGDAMLEALGQYMNARYVWDNWTHFDAADSALAAPLHADFAALQSGVYSLPRVSVRSTAVLRCLQSAGAMQRGLFPSPRSLAPAIESVPTTQDTLLFSSNTASIDIPNMAGMNPTISEWADFARFLSPQELRELAATLPFPLEACLAPTAQELQTNVWAYRGCAGMLAEVAAVLVARGDGPSFPLLYGNVSRLEAFIAANNRRVYQHNTSDVMHRARGPILYPLAQEFVRNMRTRASQLNRTASPTPAARLIAEYSAHDTTMVPVAAFLGHNELSAPPFGQAYMLELVLDSTTGIYYVQGWQGAPGTMAPPPAGTPLTAAHYRYDVTSLSIGCRRGGANVQVADGTCTLDEFSDYISSIAPRTRAGSTCYLPPAVIERIGCNKAECAADSACAIYRQKCPLHACPYGTALTVNDRTCRPLVLAGWGNVSTPPLLDPTLFWAAVAVAGGVVAVFCRRYRSLIVGRRLPKDI